MFLKAEGYFIISIKANCVDSTAAPEAVYAMEVEKLKKEKMRFVVVQYHCKFL
jgi:rRNA 2'-O-methyltransferase fibrillarin